MIKNEKYIRILKSMISCINQGDYYSIKELSNLELQKMKEDEEKNKKDIKKFRNNKKIRKNKEKPLENWNSEELKTLIENYSQFVLNKTRQQLIVYDNQPLNKNLEAKFFKGIDLLKKQIPIEHITHQKEFMKLNFFVDENVLIPRQDTEILVEEVIKIAKRIGAKRILDLCTGSGAIAVSLAKYIDDSKITALDVSSKALEIARFEC